MKSHTKLMSAGLTPEKDDSLKVLEITMIFFKFSRINVHHFPFDLEIPYGVKSIKSFWSHLVSSCVHLKYIYTPHSGDPQMVVHDIV